MFFGVTGHADAEFGSGGILEVLFHVDARVEVYHLLQEVDRIFMATGLWFKRQIRFGRVATQYEYIIDTQVVEVDQASSVSFTLKPPQIRCGTVSTLYLFMMAAQIDSVPGLYG